MNPFELGNPIAKNIAIVSKTFGQRPSEIFEELLEADLSFEDKLAMDIKSAEYISVLENAAMASANTGGNNRTMRELKEASSMKEKLKSKWASEDATARENLQQRKLEYERKLKRMSKK